MIDFRANFKKKMQGAEISSEWSVKQKRSMLQTIRNFGKEKEKPMKKIVSTMLVSVVSLTLAGLAMAAAPKPPASICLDLGVGAVYCLAMKSSSAVKMSDGTQKFYNIQGAIVSGATWPIVGSGYIEGTVFHFSVNGAYNNSGTPQWVQQCTLMSVLAEIGPHRLLKCPARITTFFTWDQEL